jgi:rieske iron-sulfur protein
MAVSDLSQGTGLAGPVGAYSSHGAMIRKMRQEAVSENTKAKQAGVSVSRRAVCQFGVTASLGLPLNLLAQPADRMRPQPGDQLVFDGGELAGQAVLPGNLLVNAAPIAVFPRDPASLIIRDGSRLNRVMLMRVDSAMLSTSTHSFAADGVIAYSAVCTHTGCDVFNWKADELRMACPCHESEFDVLNGARVVGGPAPRPLPMLPLHIEEGELRVAAEFTSRVGFQQEF